MSRSTTMPLFGSVRLVSLLGMACAMLTASYVVLMVTTIFFASWQSQATNNVRDTESAIGNLEAKYYTTINQVSETNPATLGFVTPTDVQYVSSAGVNSATLTFAGK